MTVFRKMMVALLCAGLATAPMVLLSHPAEARAGWSSRGFSSMGSFGSHTYHFNGGSAIGRSMTPRSSGYNGAYGGYRGYGNGYHPFWGGLAGGLFGGFLGSMLFPHFGYGGYGGGGGGFFSILIWLVLIFIGWRLFRRFFHGGHGGYGGGGMMGGGMMGGPGIGFMGGLGGGGMGGMGGSAMGPAGYGQGAGSTVNQIEVTQSDQTAFEAILKAVQGAWGKADLSTLRHYVTPEMLSYFSEELSQNQSEGVENHVEDVDLENGDVREAWSEDNLEYATVMLSWHARDWTVRNDGSNAVVDGDPNKPSEAQELWTFARSPSGHWLLSAIQQV
ncbi:MAG: Tim44 domain-containing protein [Stellaceae bacterium]